jgi:hypothetical protein
MVNLDLTQDEHELIMRLRKINSKPKYGNLSNNLKKQLERQERQIASVRFNDDPQKTNHDATESHFLKRIRKTIIENGILYEILLEDVGDGKGLVEKERKELGKANNINYRFTEMSNELGSSETHSYSKMIKTKIINGKQYEITYENKGDGKGIVEIDRKLIGNVNNKKKTKTKTKSLARFNTNNIEQDFFKKSNELRKIIKSKNNNRGLITKSRRDSFKKKTIIENINGKAYKVTYENINNEGFKQVNKEKI